jgi:hypothetical protein
LPNLEATIDATVPPPDSTYPFDPYDVDVSLYEDTLAAFAVGRLLQRLEWHHQQWIVLAAESGCEHRLPPSLRPIPKAERRYLREQLQEIEAAVEVERDAQRRMARQVGDQLPGVIGRFPTAARVPLLRKLGPLLDELYAIDAEELTGDARDVAKELRGRADDDQVDAIREEELHRMVTAFSLRRIDRIQQAIWRVMNDRLDAYYRVGRAVEQGLCPERAFRHMTFADPSAICLSPQLLVNDSHSGFAAAAGFTLAYHSFEPGSLQLTAAWRTICRQALQAAALWTQEISALLQSRRGDPNHAQSKAAIVKTKQPPQAQPFNFRCSANSTITGIVSSLHDQISTLRHRKNLSESNAGKAKAAQKEPVLGAYEERLELVSPHQAKLTRHGIEIKIIGAKRVQLLEMLIRGMGTSRPLRKLLPGGTERKRAGHGHPYQNLYSTVRHLNEILKELGLKAESEHGEGYKLVDVSQANPK